MRFYGSWLGQSKNCPNFWIFLAIYNFDLLKFDLIKQERFKLNWSWEKFDDKTSDRLIYSKGN